MPGKKPIYFFLLSDRIDEFLPVADEKSKETECLDTFIALREDNYMSIDSNNNIFRLAFCKSCFLFLFSNNSFLLLLKNILVCSRLQFFKSWFLFTDNLGSTDSTRLSTMANKNMGKKYVHKVYILTRKIGCDSCIVVQSLNFHIQLFVTPWAVLHYFPEFAQIHIH